MSDFFDERENSVPAGTDAGSAAVQDEGLSNENFQRDMTVPSPAGAPDPQAEIRAAEASQAAGGAKPDPVSAPAHPYESVHTEDTPINRVESPVYGSEPVTHPEGAPGAGTAGSGAGAGNAESIRKEYKSKYDAYRFQSPYEDMRYGSAPPVTSGQRTKKHDTAKKVGFVVGMAAVFAIVFGLVFSGVLALTGVIGRSSTKVTESQAAESENEVIIGNQGDAAPKQEETAPKQEEASPDKKDGEAESRMELPQIESDENGDFAEEPAGEAADSAAPGEVLSVPDVVSKVMPSMVSITNVTVQEYQNFFGETQQYEGVSAGSGIIVGKTDDDLLIATNNHVIQDAKEITVTFKDETAVAGSVKGTDADYDLAIVAVPFKDIPEATQDVITIVSIGDSDSLSVGEEVVAIGNALGYGQSVSRGIVSAIGRTVMDSDGTERELIQTDASINPGNSGGALLNMKGELIGINEAKFVDESVEGVGYAIPMSIAEPILTKLGSRVKREQVSAEQASYLGITCMTMPAAYTQSGYPSGVYVSEVVEGGPADKAGIKAGDIITSMDGTGVKTKEELIDMLTYYAAGEELEMSISRINEDKTAFEKQRITVTLGKRSESGLPDTTPDPNAGNGQQDGQQSPDSGGVQNIPDGGQNPYGGMGPFGGDLFGFFDR
ncbi:MAG: trypsin-like peptidase domain-containing protein [Lachnospiraceae bacterium]|nr:trypsin-like peptidase domain-containing protein [Lachnospiraceae bacterium]